MTIATLTGRPSRCDCDHCVPRFGITDHCACGHLFTDHRHPFHSCGLCLFCDTFRASRDGR